MVVLGLVSAVTTTTTVVSPIPKYSSLLVLLRHFFMEHLQPAISDVTNQALRRTSASLEQLNHTLMIRIYLEYYIKPPAD